MPPTTLGSIKAIKTNFSSLLSDDEHLILLHRLLFNGDAGNKASRRKDILTFAGDSRDQDALEGLIDKWTVNQIKAVMKILALPNLASGSVKSDHIASLASFLHTIGGSNNEESGSDSAAGEGENEASASASSSTKKRDAGEAGISTETPRRKRKSSFKKKAEEALLADFPYLSKKPVTLGNLSTDLWSTLPSTMKKAGWVPGHVWGGGEGSSAAAEGGGGGGGVIASGSTPSNEAVSFEGFLTVNETVQGIAETAGETITTATITDVK
jgi:hypothetical protein